MSGPAGVRAYLNPIQVTNSRANYDFRPMIRNMGLSPNRNFQCNLIAPMDIEAQTFDNESLAGNQATWFGWYYISGNNEYIQGLAGKVGHRGMEKLGDSFEAPTWDTQNRRTVETYNLLIADWDLYRRHETQLYAQSAHPDRRLQWNWQAYRQPINDTLLTLSYWQGPHPVPPVARDTIDNNFGYDDGSVQRITDIEYIDDRLVRIPNTQSTDDGWNGLQVPLHR